MLTFHVRCVGESDLDWFCGLGHQLASALRLRDRSLSGSCSARYEQEREVTKTWGALSTRPRTYWASRYTRT